MPIRFTDVAAAAGLTLRNIAGNPAKNYLIESTGNGAAFFDFDNDGDMDVLLTNGSTLEQLAKGGHPMVALYRNDGRGRFTDVTKAAGLIRLGWASGVCVADYDNDGFEDVYVTAFGPNVLWRNIRGKTLSRPDRPRIPAGARAARSATTTVTDTWTCTSPTTSSSSARRCPRAGRPPAAS